MFRVWHRAIIDEIVAAAAIYRRRKRRARVFPLIIITILCDDYDLSYAPGVKKAIDEFVANNNFNCEIVCDYRFAKIQKK